MNKIIIFGSLTAFAFYSFGHTYHHTDITLPHEDEYHEVYTRLTPEVQQMVSGSMGDDKWSQRVYHLY